jgi:hypothetical protein
MPWWAENQGSVTLPLQRCLHEGRVRNTLTIEKPSPTPTPSPPLSSPSPPPQRNVLGALPGAHALSDPAPPSLHQQHAATPAGGREHRQMWALTCEARRHDQRKHLSPPASLSPSLLGSVGQTFVRKYLVLFSPSMLKNGQVPLMFTTSGLN